MSVVGHAIRHRPQMSSAANQDAWTLATSSNHATKGAVRLSCVANLRDKAHISSGRQQMIRLNIRITWLTALLFAMTSTVAIAQTICPTNWAGRQTSNVCWKKDKDGLYRQWDGMRFLPGPTLKLENGKFSECRHDGTRCAPKAAQK